MNSLENTSLVIVPRERFSFSLFSLRDLLAKTPTYGQLIYVDGNHPQKIAEMIEKRVNHTDGTYIRRDRFLAPNEARNLALTEATGEYVVFVDNDVVVKEGWLEALVDCADETGAAIVGPVYLDGSLERNRVHMAGGKIEIREGLIFTEMKHYGEPYTPELAATLARYQTDSAEFHCMLARRDFLEGIGGLDEHLRTTREHIDICLTAAKMDRAIFCEPRSAVQYLTDYPLLGYDLGFYRFRWSGKRTDSSLKHFARKWGVQVNQDHVSWTKKRIRRAYMNYLQCRLGWKAFPPSSLTG